VQCDDDDIYIKTVQCDDDDIGIKTVQCDDDIDIKTVQCDDDIDINLCPSITVTCLEIRQYFWCPNCTVFSDRCQHYTNITLSTSKVTAGRPVVPNLWTRNPLGAAELFQVGRDVIQNAPKFHVVLQEVLHLHSALSFFCRLLFLGALAKWREVNVNPVKAGLNPIRHLLSLLGTHPILHVSRIRVNVVTPVRPSAWNISASTGGLFIKIV
jgi:hypothetical protein